MASANVSFYVNTGAEIHWRQASSFHTDPVAVKILLTGLVGMIVVQALLTVFSFFTTPYLYNIVGVPVDILGSFAESVHCRFLECYKSRKPHLPDPNSFEHVLGDEDVDDDDMPGDNLDSLPLMNAYGYADQYTPLTKGGPPPPPSTLKRSLVLLVAFLLLLLRFIRPAATSYGYLSLTLLLTPFEKTPTVREWNDVVDLSWLPGDYGWLDNRTALDTPPKFDWLLPQPRLPGFRDWNVTAGRQHYNPARDPIHVSNLGLPVLESLRDVLHNGSVPIKHVFVIKLESTREDVFPVRRESSIYNRVRRSYDHGQIPDYVERNLSSLTPTAERLTGTPSGFGPQKNGDRAPYGGIHATNSYTSSTYTLKSLVGSLCGVTPLVADFNREYSHNIYQPCLAQILEAMNVQKRGVNASESEDFITWPWHPAYMQSVTDDYDFQHRLTLALGYKHVVNKEILWNDHVAAANNATVEGRKPNFNPLNFLGFSDNELLPYFRRIINRAEKRHERLFLTHLTGVTHHPWTLPGGKRNMSVYLDSELRHDKFNRYLSSIGLADRWLGQILDLLEETGVANETLLVITGDQ